MADIYFAMVISLLVFVGLLLAGAAVGHRLSRAGASLVLLVGSCLLILYALVLLDNVAWTRWLPISNVMILGNISIPIVGLFVGIGSRQLPRPWWRRSLLLVPLTVLCLYKAYAPIFVTQPRTGNRWSNGVCMQTSDSTCGAAAAATLLTHHRIPANETQMAELCFTGRQGTSMLGIYRGLKLMTQQTALTVRAVTGGPAELRRAVADGPVLIAVGLRRGQRVDPRYTERWGWLPGTMHTVVVYRIDRDDRVWVGDPRIGREYWFIEGIETLWHGQGLQIVNKESAS